MQITPPKDPELCGLLCEIRDYAVSHQLNAEQMRTIVHAGIGAIAAVHPEWVAPVDAAA